MSRTITILKKITRQGGYVSMWFYHYTLKWVLKHWPGVLDFISQLILLVTIRRTISISQLVMSFILQITQKLSGGNFMDLLIIKAQNYLHLHQHFYSFLWLQLQIGAFNQSAIHPFVSRIPLLFCIHSSDHFFSYFTNLSFLVDSFCQL